MTVDKKKPEPKKSVKSAATKEKIPVTNNARVKKAPVFYSPELVEKMMDKVASGTSLNKVCKMPGMPARKTFFAWVENDPKVKGVYELALMMRGDLFGEEIIEIADDTQSMTYIDADGVKRFDQGAVTAAKLRANMRQWVASKLLPRRYGDRIVLAGDSDNPLHVQMVQDASSLLSKIKGAK